MAMLDEIGTRLSTQGIASSSGAGGWRLVLGHLPDSTALGKAVALIQSPGLAPDAFTEVDKPGLQVQVRGDSLIQVTSAYQDAETKAMEIRNDLHTLGPVTLSGRYYPAIWADQDPFLMEMDDQKRPVLVCNYSLFRSRT